jgi:hypothetical protein
VLANFTKNLSGKGEVELPGDKMIQQIWCIPFLLDQNKMLGLQREFLQLNVLEHARLLKIEDLNWSKRCCKVSSTLPVAPDQESNTVKTKYFNLFPA